MFIIIFYCGCAMRVVGGFWFSFLYILHITWPFSLFSPLKNQLKIVQLSFFFFSSKRSIFPCVHPQWQIEYVYIFNHIIRIYLLLIHSKSVTEYNISRNVKTYFWNKIKTKNFLNLALGFIWYFLVDVVAFVLLCSVASSSISVPCAHCIVLLYIWSVLFSKTL